MSWSHSFTGKLSILKDTGYRVPIIINIDDIGSNNDDFISNLKALFKLNFLHIILNVPLYYDITYNFNDFINSMQVIYSLQHDVEAADGISIMLTLKISIITMLEVFIDLISAHYLHFDIILLQIDDKEDQKHQQQHQEHDQFQQDLQEQQQHHHHQIDKNNKNEIVDNIIMISNLLTDIFNNQSLSFTLGIGNIRSLDDLDWYLINIPIDIIQFIHLGSFQLPNIRTRWIELIYTQGINVWYDMMIDNDTDIISSSSSDIINQLSHKYQVSSMTFLVKCLLQLGIIVSIPMIINQNQYQHQHQQQQQHHDQQQQQLKHNLQYITEQYSRLVHPFNYRKSFVSAVKIISLRIDYIDIKLITDISDEIECSLIDKEWKPYVISNAIEPRQLKY